jgi:LuxR family maltose regulon positive regulatory protein
VVARPGLSGRLGSARVTVISAPPGSGKTVLLRSWVGEAGLAGRVGWVTAGRDERDPQWFWLSVLNTLRRTDQGAALVQALTAAPELDGWAVVERLLTDLAPLRERIWLVIDDLHELSSDVLEQLELLVLRAPPGLRFVLATRHDVRLGLHRPRLEAELAEIRDLDLRFTVAEARELFDAAGVELSEPALMLLHERTEGWVAGLRLAALSLAGHPAPERFAAEFSGSERTVAEYLLAEVLDRRSDEVRRLLVRTSVLERVNGELADLLTGGSGGERMLQDLERAGAFTVSLDAGRSWFRYHQMFAGMLALELRRTAPGEVTGLHRAASGWFAVHGYPVEAIRHAQQARDWGLAVRLLADHWPGLYLDGKAAAVHELLAEFPARTREGDAELAAVAAVDELASGSVEAAEQYLSLAEQGSASVPDARQGQARLLLGIARLLVARHRGNLSAVVEEAGRLRAMAEAPGVTQLGLSEDLRALALINLGITEYWTARYDEAERHLEQGVGLARRIGRPFLELTGQAYQAALRIYHSFAVAAEKGMQAVELARVHGWTDQPAAGIAYGVLAATLEMQGRLDEAEPWIQRAERTVEAEAEPVAGMGVRYVRGILELARGRFADALAAFQAVEQMGGHVAAQHQLIARARVWRMYTLVRLGESGRAWQVLAGFGDQVREGGEARMAVAVLRLAQNDPGAAVAALAPVLDGSVPVAVGRSWLVHAFLLEAIARDALSDSVAAEHALERALDLAESDGTLLWFLLFPAPGLLERHAPHRTAHAALIAGIRNLLAGSDHRVSPVAGQRTPVEPLRDSELRVLRYLPTNLSAPEIAAELSVSRNTVKSHMRNLYAKLGTHRRAETVARARELGLLAPSAPSARPR